MIDRWVDNNFANYRPRFRSCLYIYIYWRIWQNRSVRGKLHLRCKTRQKQLAIKDQNRRQDDFLRLFLTGCKIKFASTYTRDFSLSREVVCAASRLGIERWFTREMHREMQMRLSRKTLTFCSRSSMLTIACCRITYIPNMVYMCIHERRVYAGPVTRLLWRTCRGNSIWKAVRSWRVVAARDMPRAHTQKIGRGCVGVKVDSCWYDDIASPFVWLHPRYTYVYVKITAQLWCTPEFTREF